VSLMVVIALWALRSGWVQNRLTPLVEEVLGDALGVKVEVGSVDIDLPSRAVLSDLTMYDRQQQTMFALKQLKVGFGSFSLVDFLLHPHDVQSIKVSDVQVTQPVAHLYRSRCDRAWNFDCLRGSGSDTTPSRPMRIMLAFPSVELRHGEFTMVDSTRSDAALSDHSKINFSNISLKEINGHVSYHLDPDLKMYGTVEDFNVVDSRSKAAIRQLQSLYLIRLRPAKPSRLSICLENTRIRIGRTDLDMDLSLEDIRSDSSTSSFNPVFTAHFRTSEFDFLTLNEILDKPLPLAQPLTLKGYVWGDMDGIYSDSLLVGMMQHTQLRTSLAITGYTEAKKLRFKCTMDRGLLSFEELQQLLPDTKIPLHGVVGVKGNLSGTLDQLRSTNLEVRYLDQTHLFADARITDYARSDDILMDITFRKSKFQFNEIKQLLPGMNLPPWLQRFGTCSIDGKFLGGIQDFVVNADMTTAYGNLSSNLHLTLPPQASKITYDGWLKTEHLNLAGLGADLPVSSGNLNFEGHIKGAGTEWGGMRADLDGKFLQSDFSGYHIEEIRTDSLQLSGYKITGGVEVRDKYGSASVTVDLDLPDSSQHYFVVGDIKRLNLAHYGLLPADSVYLSTILNINLDGRTLEDYTGKMRFLQASLTRDQSKDSLTLRNTVLTSKLDDLGRHVIRLRSSMADMDLVGDFTYLKAAEVAGMLAKETQLYINNKDTLTSAYYAQKVIDTVRFELQDTFRTKRELDRALAFFNVPLYLHPGTELRIRFVHAATDEVGFVLRSDSLNFETVGMKDDSVDISLRKHAAENHLLGRGYVGIRRMTLGENLHLRNVEFEPTAVANQVDYFLRASQPEIGSDYQINAQTHFQRGGEINTKIIAEESRIVIRNRTWQFNKDNSIDHRYEKPPVMASIHTDSLISRYHINGLKLSNEGQSVSLDGVISKDPTDILTAEIGDLQIGRVLQILRSPPDMGGMLTHAKIEISKLLSSQPALHCMGEVQNFRYQRVDSIGIKFSGGWPYLQRNDYAGMRVVLGHWGEDSLIASGWYNVRSDSIHFDADTSSLQLSWVQPFVNGILSDLNGRVTLDDFKVRGTASRPTLEGTARFTNTSFKMDYLNNVFRIGDNQIRFDEERIKISRVILQDTIDGHAEVNGSVLYNNAAGVQLAIDIQRIQHLQVMDTRKQDNESYYGRIILDGDSARVTGFADAPEIEAWVHTGDGSTLDIPISEYTSANRLDFVNFIRKEDTMYRQEMTGFKGMKMTLNVNAQKNARVRLIFDEFAGDIIEARGDGNIIVKVDEDGEFSMYGTYVIDEGNYHFTMENVLNKKFIVNRGGRITWNGDPYDALLELDAVYKVNADMSAVLGSSNGGNRVPVEIIMHMKGSLMSPEITLELQLQMTEQDVFGLATFFQGIQYDQQELNKQVVSLLMFRRFSGTSTATASAGAAGVTSSISELVSNQVNHWLSQAFSDPKMGVEINSNEFQDVQLALRASLFNDRVTVERNGTLIGNTSGNLSIGDLLVLIKVLPKPDTVGKMDPDAGQLVMEIFNREDASITNSNNVTRGTGLFYKKDFDRLSDFFGKNSAARKEEGIEN
jgi:hypothetical protein